MCIEIMVRILTCVIIVHAVFTCISHTFNSLLHTEGHDGEVFSSELAGHSDLLPQGPTSFRDSMMSCCWRVMTNLQQKHNL